MNLDKGRPFLTGDPRYSGYQKAFIEIMSYSDNYILSERERRE